MGHKDEALRKKMESDKNNEEKGKHKFKGKEGEKCDKCEYMEGHPIHK